VNEAQFLARTFARLPTADCDGCHRCASKCVGDLKITRTEFEAIREYLGGPIWQPRIRGAGEMLKPCEFQDPDGWHCMVYPVRPLVCRLFGVVEWLPCPVGRIPALVEDGLQIVRQYGRFPRHSFRQWARMRRPVQGSDVG